MRARVATDAIVIGAGMAGLATAAALRGAGVDFVLLEQGPDVGAFWSGHYDRIRLHSPWHDLPHDGGLRHRFGMLLGRDDLVAYLRAYAKHHALFEHAAFGQRVLCAARGRNGWDVDTATHRFSAPYLVVATGAQRVPVRVEVPGRERFRGAVLHSRDYRNGIPFRGARVLIVGSGNSAAEIALDLAHAGAHPALWVRGPRHFVPLRAMARMGRVAAWLPSKLVERAKDRAHAVRRADPRFPAVLRQRDALFEAIGIDLEAYGIERPALGPMSEMYLRGRVPVYDQGTAAAIRAGRIAVIDGKQRPLVRFTASGMRLGDRDEPYEAIVLATGFHAGLAEFLAEPERLVAWDAPFRTTLPITDGNGRSAVEPTLFFPGFDLSSLGGLALGRWGFDVGRMIAGEVLG